MCTGYIICVIMPVLMLYFVFLLTIKKCSMLVIFFRTLVKFLELKPPCKILPVHIWYGLSFKDYLLLNMILHFWQFIKNIEWSSCNGLTITHTSHPIENQCDTNFCLRAGSRKLQQTNNIMVWYTYLKHIIYGLYNLSTPMRLKFS